MGKELIGRLRIPCSLLYQVGLLLQKNMQGHVAGDVTHETIHLSKVRHYTCPAEGIYLL